jgi:hypothetical protein
VREQVVAETRGNPLALIELTRGLSPAQLAGGFGLPAALSLQGRIEERFRQRLEALPEDTRRLLQVAAAEPVGDPALVWRAAGWLGIPAAAAVAAQADGLLEIGKRVRFRHPLVRVGGVLLSVAAAATGGAPGAGRGDRCRPGSGSAGVAPGGGGAGTR